MFTSAVAGSMLCHAETAITAIDASGLGQEDADPGLSGYDIDEGWNEYDHIGIANAHDAMPSPRSSWPACSRSCAQHHPPEKVRPLCQTDQPTLTCRRSTKPVVEPGAVKACPENRGLGPACGTPPTSATVCRAAMCG